MNVNQLQPPPPPQLQRFSKEGSDKDADFLALRLLNKRSRLRLSPQPVELDAIPGKGRLFAVSNTRGWFVAATRNVDGSHALVVSPLVDLRSALASSSSTDTPLSPRASVPLPGTPHIVAFTHDGHRLLVAFTNGPVSVYDSQSIFSGTGSAPLHTFPSASGKAIRDLLPCTGDAEQVAILREPGDGLPVEIVDVNNMTSVGGWSSGDPSTNPTSLSWSPKGKQIAIGLENGNVVTFSPTDTSAVKSVVPHPPAVEGQCVISTTWLSNTEYHAIYAPTGPLAPETEQTHYILSLEAKANTVGDVKLTSPYLPFPGLRPPGSFTVVLRSWDPSRLLLFVGDSTSSDVGLLGSLSDSASPLDSWYNLTLEETSTPSVPLDADLNETVLLGLELDLTDTEPFKFTGASGEEQDVPPPPIMYLYASDGTVTGWHVIQTQGVAYPGMVAESAAATTPTAAPVQTTPQQSVFGTSHAASTSPFASTSPQNAAGPSTGAFGFSAFSGATSAFGSTSFGFGQPPAQQQSTTSPPTAPAMSTPTISVDMTSSSDDNMASETDSGFGGLSLGGGGDSSKPNTASNSMFGSFGATTQQQPSTSPFGGGATSSSTFGAFGAGPVKPASGFGAFSNNGPSAFGSSSGFGSGAFSAGGGAFSGGAFSGGSSGGAFASGGSAFGSKATESPSSGYKPSSGFGQSGLGTSSTPAFGQSSFGSSASSGSAFSGLGQSSSAFGKTSFGQSSFGQSAFGQSAFGQTSTPASTTPKPPSTSAFGGGGGFASFANAGTSAFGAVAQQKQDAKPVWAASSNQSSNSEQSKPAFGAPAPTPFGGATPSAFDASSSSTPASTSAAPVSTTALATPEKPTPAVSTPPATPPAKSADTATKTPAPTKSTTTPTATPAASGGAFGSLTTTPAAPLPSTGGAFGGLTTSSTGFSKLQPGFGAFGGTTSTSSPFFQKPSTTTPTTSVFGQTSFGSGTTTPTSKSDVAGTPAFGAPSFGTPSFGASSAFGSAPSTSFFGKSNLSTSSPFGKPADSTPPKTPTTTPSATSAFSAFSGGSSPFGSAAASGAGKSFGEMLRGGDKGKDKEKEGDEAKKDGAKPTGFSKTAEEWKRPVSVFASLKQAEKASDKGKDDDDDAEAEAEEDEGADTSFRSHEDDDDVDDGIDAFLKSDEEDLGSDEDDVPPEVEEEDEVEEEEATTSSQLAPESPTVKQAAPPKTPPSIFSGISFTPPTPPKDKGKEKEGEPSKPVLVREGSTTPPGSPEDRVSPEAVSKPAAVPRATSAPPASAPGTSASSAFLGVRPSTRPARSSPLAKPAYSEDDEDDGGDGEKVPSPSKKARSESPSIPAFGIAQSRPKTPPMLFGTSVAPPKPAPFSLAPSASPTIPPAKSSPAAAAGTSAEPAKLPTPSASPSPSLSGPGAPGSTSIFGTTPSVFAPPASSGGGFFGQRPLGTPETQTSLFGQKAPPPGGLFGMAKPPTLTPPGGGIFSASPAPAQSKPSSPVSSTPPVFAGFGTPAASQPAKPSALFPSAPAAVPTPSAPPSLSRPPSVAPAMPPASPVQDMQSEFALLFTSLNRELEDLKALAAHASMRAAQLKKPGTGSKTSQDLTEPTKWVLSDLTAFVHIMKEVERELGKWQSEKEKCISYLRELESDMLKGSTRKEEIERFSKASKDTDFARMLKARMLSPDHLETQSQLRREIRTIRGRLQQLEDYIQSSKKKLNSVKSGKPTIKPPSLDTINRTYRNIDIAIDQEEEDVSNLAERLATLEVSSKSPLVSFSASTRDRRLPDRNQRVGREVTPNIAASTAAALNAERSAQKLKRALLNVRKQPLLNTKAVDAAPPERELRTPRKPLLAPGSGVDVGAAFAAGLQGGFPALAGSTPIKTEPSSPEFQWTPPPPGSIPPPSWSLPPFELEGGSPLAGLGGSRSRGPREKQHAKPIQMHRETAKPPPPPPPAGFSWGPVPVIQPKNTISIFAGIGDSKGKAKEEPSSGLGGSWVADGFSTSTPK